MCKWPLFIDHECFDDAVMMSCRKWFMAALMLIHFFILTAALGVPATEEPAAICHRVYSNLAHISVERDDDRLPVSNGDSPIDNRTSEVCSNGNHRSCYTFWRERKTPQNVTEIFVIAKGCWESSGREDCNSPICVANGRPPPKQMNDTKFCCCTGHLCNFNVTAEGSISSSSELTVDRPQHSLTVSHLSARDTILIIIACCVTLSIGFIGLIALCKSYCSSTKPQMSDSVRLVENVPNDCPLKMIELIGQGRYGTLWKGMDKDGQVVAVKIFPPHYRQLYTNERDTYSLPFMDSPALLNYYGYQESLGRLQLILLYCSHGCLQDYLKVHTVDSTVFCRMASSIARGLAHLHTEIRQGDKVKPCICHRDLNTRNILVKSDLSCCLCDLGLAIQIDTQHIGGEDAARKSISDVGTLRYMAPEVLEGAVNLRDCESSLKQIDVYASGLVLWELGTRCTDFYINNATVAPYAMPFQAEIGEHPSFEQMQVMVSRNKARPLFPSLWKDWKDCAAVRLLRETVEDCWDQDAEARLTALCVEERLVDLTQLCQRESLGNYPYSLGAQIISFNNATSEGLAPEDTVDSNLSEGTVETLLTMSPSECVESAPVNPWKDSNNRAAANVPIAIQPHQGRNPCLERNLLVWGDSHEVDATPLVDKSMKHRTPLRVDIPQPQPAAANIPYVHNRVPKQSNVPPSTQLPGFIRKLLLHKKSNLLLASEDHHLLTSNTGGGGVKVTVSPFEKYESSDERAGASGGGRPTSLPLPLELGSVFTDARSSHMKRELSARIKTPGDVPPSVRRKRARLSLYDDRIMDQSASSF